MFNKAFNFPGGFNWLCSNNKNSEFKLVDFVSANPMKLEQLKIKVQVFASKFALNNCREDMAKIAQYGCICVTYNEYEENSYENDEFGKQRTILIKEQALNINIIKKEEKFSYSRNDFVMRGIHSHLFFEIPVIQNFTEHQFNKWLNYLARELPKKANINVKRRQIWLKKKQLNEDFNE